MSEHVAFLSNRMTQQYYLWTSPSNSEWTKISLGQARSLRHNGATICRRIFLRDVGDNHCHLWILRTGPCLLLDYLVGGNLHHCNMVWFESHFSSSHAFKEALNSTKITFLTKLNTYILSLTEKLQIKLRHWKRSDQDIASKYRLLWWN